MIERNIEIINRLGLHARATAKLVALATRFACLIELSVGTKKINAKSIMGVMMLAASKGTIITVHCSGDDEEAAMEAIEGLINDRFGEGE